MFVIIYYLFGFSVLASAQQIKHHLSEQMTGSFQKLPSQLETMPFCKNSK